MVEAFNLERFVHAQEDILETAVAQLRAGKKESHWMWFVFPQLESLGRSATARYFGIRSVEEARAFLAHPALGPAYRRSVEAILGWAGRKQAAAILGEIDAMKLRSSLTLFERASGDPLYAAAIDAFFDGPDQATLERLGQPQG